MQPLVSVIIPLYNCELYIDKCIDSIINQTYKNIEILISDDYSTDRSKDIVKKWLQFDSRIILFEQPKNLGLLKNYNFLFFKSKGEYIVIQDSDDWSDYNKIEKQVSILNINKDIGIVGCFRRFYLKNKFKSTPLLNSDQILNGPTTSYLFCPASYMFRSEILFEIPGLNDYFDGGTSMDVYFINEILSKYKGYCINENLYNHNVRQHSNTKGFSQQKIFTKYLCDELIKQRQRNKKDWLQSKSYDLIDLFKKDLLNNKIVLSEAYREAAVFNVDFCQFKSAIYHLIKAFRYRVNLMNFRTLFYLIRKAIIKSE